MATTLLSLEEYLTWAQQPEAGTDDTEIEEMIDAAAAWIKAHTGRLLEEDAAIVEILDGEGPRVGGRYREILYLARANKPFGSTLPVVLENGESLTVASGYSTTAPVIWVPAEGKLIRQGGNQQVVSPSWARTSQGWSRGYQNISVTYTGGYAAAAVPENIKQVMRELTGLFYKDPQRVGTASKSKAGHAVTLLRELSKPSQVTVNGLKIWSV